VSISNAESLDQRLLRSSNCRVILSGDTYERYDYALPYFYNRPPPPRGSGWASGWSPHRRADNLAAARALVRRIISCNVAAYDCVPKFVTYTFAKNITSLAQANSFWRRYCKRLGRSLGPRRYIVVAEFQKRGAVHYHALYFDLPFVPRLKYRIADLWGYGFVKVKGISHVRNVAAYLCKYLQKDLVDARLRGEKAYFCSRRLLRPVLLRDPVAIDRLSSRCILVPRATASYPSAHFGTISYTQGSIIPLSHEDNSSEREVSVLSAQVFHR